MPTFRLFVAPETRLNAFVTKTKLSQIAACGMMREIPQRLAQIHSESHREDSVAAFIGPLLRDETGVGIATMDFSAE